MNEEIIEYIIEKNNVNYSREYDAIVFHSESLINKLEKNKLLKEDREMLIDALKILQQAY